MNGEVTKMFVDVFDFLLFAFPIAIPIILIWVGTENFIYYKRKKFRNKLKWTLLEIIPPAEVSRSPASMELFLLALHQTGGESDWYEKYVNGKFRSRFSLELISQEGRIRFFIRTESKNRAVVESGLYSQYPGIEVFEAEDYTEGIYWDPDKIDMFGIELELTKADAYPIKTFIDYQLDMNPDTEFRIDPMAPMLEFLETVKPQNQFWIQILVKAHKKEDYDMSKLFPALAKKKDNWDDEGKKEINKLREASFFEVSDDLGKKRFSNQQTTGQKNIIAAIERSLSKFSFDIGIRCVAVAPKDKFDPGNKAMKGIWKQYGSNDLNGFKPGYSTEFDWWYEDPFDTRVNRMKDEMLDAYKQREYFWRPRLGLTFGPFFFGHHPRKKMILNTEELATIYHFMGKVSEAPSVAKVDARKSAPPNNLPI